MTVESTIRTVEYEGNGVTNVFPFKFPVYSRDHLFVSILFMDTGQVIELGADEYLTTGVEPFSFEGTVRYPVSGNKLAAGQKIIITRTVPYTQQVSIRNQDGFYPEVVEQQMDLLEMQIQQSDSDADNTLLRSLRVPKGETVSEFPEKALRGKKIVSTTDGGDFTLSAFPGVALADGTFEFNSAAAFEASTPDPVAQFARLAGFYAPDGKGRSLYQISVSEPAHAGKRQTADGRWWALAEMEVKPYMFGAVDGGIVSNDTVFPALETYAKGQVVDLERGFYKVTTVPTGNIYINGAFTDGTNVTKMPRFARSQPFEDKPSVVVKFDEKTHIWAGPLIYIPSLDMTACVWVEGEKHNTGGPTVVQMALAQNGVDLREEVTVFSRADRSVQHTQGQLLAGDRILLIHSTFDAASNPKLVASISDDYGVTFSEVDITMSNQWDLGYGPAIGDTNGQTMHCFGYGGGKIVHFKTTDNGATFSDTLALSGYPTLVEPWTERIDANRGIMLLRDDAGGQIRVSLTSDNFATFSAPVASGIIGGANPVSAIIFGGNLYIYIYARKGAEIYDRADVQLYWEVPLEELWANNGVIPLKYRGPLVGVSAKTHLLGYDYFGKTRSGLIRAFSAGEDITGSANASASQLVFQLTDPPTLSAPAYVKSVKPGENLLDNGCFTKAQRGTSFSLDNSNAYWADRWCATTNGAGGKLSISQSTIPARFQNLFTSSPRYAWHFNSSAGPKTYMGIYQRTADVDLIHRIASRKLSLQLYGLGIMAGPADCFISLDFGTGGSPTIFTDTAVFKTQIKNYGAWKLSTIISGFDLAGKTFGPNPVMTTHFRFEGITPWDGYLIAAKMEVGDPSPIVYGGRDELEVMLKYYELMQFDSGAMVGAAVGGGAPGVEAPFTFTRKWRKPAGITPSSTSALTVGGVTTNALSFADFSQDRARLLTTQTSGVLAAGATAVIKTNASLSLAIEADLVA